ncbi:MAG: cytochrome c3 family protein, partial [Burkholderiales bacterium]
MQVSGEFLQSTQVSSERATRSGVWALLTSLCVSARSGMYALLGGVLLSAGLMGLTLPALAQQSSAFDHLTTGFPLVGAHEQVRCETCHIKGIFKGTPKDCATCHVQGNQRGAVSKPDTHIQTTQTCDSCHTMASFRGAMFSHVAVAPGSCSSCHNGIRAVGKTASHIPTTASCDQCHNASSFGSVSVPANHIPYAATAQCAACHT